MDTVKNMQRAIDFVEDNILDDLSSELIASQAFMSSFHFQKTFSVICGITLGEYIRKRKLTLAGTEVISTSTKIVDIAFKYGYESHESFSRAFTRFHNVSPMTARSQGEINSYNKISVKSVLEGNLSMERLRERRYSVKENGTVYYTRDLGKTLKWFEDILGWYGAIDENDEQGNGAYGCLLPLPDELVNLKIATFNGIHMFYGEPSKQVVSFIRVDNIQNLHGYVTKKGWQDITDITTQPWGGKECAVTTIDGSIMRFFQLD